MTPLRHNDLTFALFLLGVSNTSLAHNNSNGARRPMRLDEHVIGVRRSQG